MYDNIHVWQHVVMGSFDNLLVDNLESLFKLQHRQLWLIISVIEQPTIRIYIYKFQSSVEQLKGLAICVLTTITNLHKSFLLKIMDHQYQWKELKLQDRLQYSYKWVASLATITMFRTWHKTKCHIFNTKTHVETDSEKFANKKMSKKTNDQPAADAATAAPCCSGRGGD
jgi:hypothetical protein